MALITVNSQQLSAVCKQSYSIHHDVPNVNLYKNDHSEFHVVRKHYRFYIWGKDNACIGSDSVPADTLGIRIGRKKLDC